MIPHLALLRAVNVGGRTVAMAELRVLFEGLGFDGAKTLLQTGNVIFRAEGADQALERRLEAAFADRFGFAADFIVRSAAEWERALAANPFLDEARDDPSHLVLMPLKAAPTGKLNWPGPERIALGDRCAYLVYPEGIGRSKLTITVVEKALGVRGTGRNWNTALKLRDALT
jgi:uncharacterized protein (DUF1697 family)